ncbi:hypothetical protein Q3G72_006347 [Acer saccharum]|nr:hypothetical protein Q3G72_006347 [Acer saccharum]
MREQRTKESRVPCGANWRWFQILSKLGWGHFSTVWLASDTSKFIVCSVYVALKVQKCAQHYTEAAMDEIKILKQVADGDPDDSKCVVKPWITLSIRVQMDSICVWFSMGLDYMHRQLSIIHTDLKPENVLLLSMIDPSKDPRKSGAPLILPPKKDKIQATESSASKDVKNSKASSPDVYVDVKANGDSVGERQNCSAIKHDSEKSGGMKDANEANQSRRRPSRSTRKKLLESVDLKCKLVDFRNAC